MSRSQDIIIRPPVATAAAAAPTPILASAHLIGHSSGTATGVVTSPGRIQWRYDERRANRAAFALAAYSAAAAAVPAQALAPVSASVAAIAVAYVLYEPRA